MKIVLASRNPKKAAELQRMANKYARRNLTIVCLDEIPEAKGVEQAEENGTSFLQNAEIKARYWAEKLQMPALAEDSGIEIEALDGAPGVYTKRVVEMFCPNEDVDVDKPGELYPKLLKLMDESGNPSKKACWVSAMFLALPNKSKNILAQNCLDGEMCECAGKREFGFDQYFKPDGHNRTLSEMEPEEKDAIGPRLKSFKYILRQI